MNGLPTDENDSPHKSEYEFEHRWQLQTDMRYGIKFRSFFRGDPNYYQRVFDPLFPHYRGLPEDCQRLQRTQSEEYLQKMQGCYTIEVLSKSYDRRTFPTYDRVKVLGNKIRFSGGTRLNKVRQEQELNRPRETYLRFFEGKKTNRIYCDNYGSFINLEESDFVNQILFEDRDGYRLRFTRINGRGQLAVTSEKKEMFSRNNNQRCCNTCGAPKPFT